MDQASMEMVKAAGRVILSVPACPPAGLNETGSCPGTEVRLGERWSLLMYTDGLIEGRIGQGSERLGSEGLMELIRAALRVTPDGNGTVSAGTPVDGELLDWVISQVRELNGGALDDDLAVLALGYSPDR